MSEVATVRTEHPLFVYAGYSASWGSQSVKPEFFYQLSALHFTHTVTIPYTQAPHFAQQMEYEGIIKMLGLLEGLNYWKLSAATEYRCEALQLPAHLATWFHDVLLQGMGEYFFVNAIDFTSAEFVKITSNDQAPQLIAHHATTPSTPSSPATEHKTLIALGGGKDSIVTLELLRKKYSDDQLGVVLINPVEAARAVAKHSGLSVIQIARALDPQIFQLNTQGFLNGHVPISAIYAAILTLTAKLNGFDQVVVSNERSSNEESLLFHGQPINHQFSKSFAFEAGWNAVANQVLSNAPLYYSFVRPLYEIQIVRLFSQMPEYHPIFRSCNRGSKTNTWCGQCPKCLFAALMLHSFLPPQEVTPIFGTEILQDSNMQKYLDELTGLSPQKPLECVGTRQESSIACFLAAQQYQKQGKDIPPLLQGVLTRLDPNSQHNWEQEAATLLQSWNSEHALPPDSEALLKKEMNR